MSDCGYCQARPTRDQAVICDDCTQHLERNIGDLPALLAELVVTETMQARIERGTSRREPDAEMAPDPSEHIRRSDGTIVPAHLRSRHGRITLPTTGVVFNEAASDLHSEAKREIERLATAAGWIADGVSVPAHYLLSHVPGIRLAAEAPQFCVSVEALRSRIERRIDRPPARWFAGPCKAEILPADVQAAGNVAHIKTPRLECERDLYAYFASETVKCDGYRGQGKPGCGTEHDVGERRVWLVDEVEDALVTIDDLLFALPKLWPALNDLVNRGNVRRWARRGRLEVRSVDTLGREMFRGGDILAMIRDEAVRPGPRKVENRQAG